LIYVVLVSTRRSLSRAPMRIRSIVDRLRGGELDSTCAVEFLGRELEDCLIRAFNVLHVPRNPRAALKAPWFDDACEVAKRDMLEWRRAMIAGGFPKAGDAWEIFCDKRAEYNRAKRAAKANHHLEQFSAALAVCRRDSRALWRMINGAELAACPIDDLAGWSEFFDCVYNGNLFSASGSQEGAWPFFNAINIGSGAEPLDDEWRSCEPVRARREGAAVLNTPITIAEVEAALKSLRNNKSQGLERVSAECYRHACSPGDGETPPRYTLAPMLRDFFEHVRVSGDFPQQFRVTCLSPLHKKGSTSDMANYRGLAVGGALAKCYASILERRLAAWSEDKVLRSPFQGGFRAKRGTLHNLLILRHLLAKHRRRGSKPLYVCQIDFEKAFDKVPRELLWSRLEERGVHGDMLRALRASYDRVLLRVKVNGRLGPAFESKQGVKQGCPLSPTLFGFFIEVIADYLEVKDRENNKRLRPQDCPKVGDRRIPLLLYADDLSLFATSRARLVEALAVLTKFCDAFGMRVNASKSELVVVHACPQRRDLLRREVVSYKASAREAAVAIEHKTRVRYLGLHYGPDAPFASCTAERLEAGRGAMWALAARLDQCRIWAPELRMRCFDVQVRSVLSYGAQLWGPDKLLDALEPVGGDAWERALADPLVVVQKDFLKRCCNAHNPPLRLLYRELSQLPLHYYWARLACGFWNALVKLPAEDLLCTVFRADIVLALESGLEADCWAAKMIRFFRAVGYESQLDLPPGDWPACICGDPERAVGKLSAHVVDIPKVLSLVRDGLQRRWADPLFDSLPRSFPEAPGEATGSGISLSVYKHWMGAPFGLSEDRVWHAYLCVYVPRDQLIALSRFRLCDWPLEVRRRTCWTAQGPAYRPRSERLCRLCSQGVEDERHVLFECPAYCTARSQCPLDFPAVTSDQQMLAFMRSSDPCLLANLLHRMQHIRRLRLCPAS
jgi:hypothetical protein